MRTNNSWVRLILALVAVLMVAGPGMVLAFDPGSYVPKLVQVLGPSAVAPGGSAEYDARVTFTNNVTVDLTGAEVGLTFSAVNGTISASGAYTNTSGTREAVTAAYTANGITVTGRRIIRIQ